jgi:hypothetical protein
MTACETVEKDLNDDIIYQILIKIADKEMPYIEDRHQLMNVLYAYMHKNPDELEFEVAYGFITRIQYYPKCDMYQAVYLT